MNRFHALEAALVTAGRISFVGFWFIAVLIVYRGLGKTPQGLADAGAFAISIACVKVVTGFISDPIDLAVVRRAPLLLAADAARAFDVLRASFAIRMLATLAVAAALAALTSFVDLSSVGAGTSPGYLRLAAVAIVGDALMRAVLSVMQVQERFRQFVLLEGAVSVSRFGAILLLWSIGVIRVDLVLACYASASFVVAGLGLFLCPSDLLRRFRVRASDIRDILNYLRWVAPAMLLAAVNERIDVFLVFTLTGAAAAGLYGAALTLALIPDILAGCLSTLIQPRIVKLHVSGAYPASQRTFITYSLVVCGAAYGLSLLFAEPFFALTLGPKYVAAAPAFHWLLAGTLFWLATTPLPMTLIAVEAPRRILLVTIAQSSLVLIGGLLLVPRHGWLGMAQTIFMMRVVVAILIVIAARGIVTSRDVVVGSAVPQGSALS